MDWTRDLPDWPLSHLSRRVTSRPHRWHLQEAGAGKTLLLLHGAGASTHSWRALITPLARDHHVIALDLPGHGFTAAGTRARSGLAPMAMDIAALCRNEGWQPHTVIGHSAGAALALRLADDAARSGARAPRILGLNAALDRFEGVAGWLFPVLARILALNPLTSLFFSAGGNRQERARRLISSTGSNLDEEGLALYARLIGDRSHVEGVLQMMAQWDVAPLVDAFPRIEAPCLLVTAEGDRAVPPAVSRRAADLLSHARHLSLPGLGHLAHEEAPEKMVEIIRAFCAEP